MALSQETLYSVVYTLKHNPYQYWIEHWDLHGPMLFRWIGSSLVNFFTFQWLGWLIHLPVVRPDALASILHEYNFPPITQYSTSVSNVPGMMSINNIIPTTLGNNQFVLGLLNSPALVIGISTTTVFCFRWLCIDEIRWGALLAFFGNFLGNWLVIVAVLFGLDDILAHWYFLTPLTYVGGMFFIWRLVWKWIRLGRRFDAEILGPFGMDPVTWRGIKMGLTGFILGLTEQTVLFQKLIQPLSPEQIHLLHGFNSGTVRDHMLMHGSYVAGLFVGGFLLGSLILAILVPAADWLCNEGWVTDAKLLLVIVMMTSISVPYYGVDYLMSRFVSMSRSSGWQAGTIFDPSKEPKPIKTILQTKQTVRGYFYDEARPWLEGEHLYPERKWNAKVKGESDLTLFQMKTALDASKLTGTSFVEQVRARWRIGITDEDITAPSTSKDIQEGWNLISHHFYKWTEEETLRRNLQKAMKIELQKARYRMIRLRNVYDRIYVMKNDKITVQDIEFGSQRSLTPPSDVDTKFGASAFLEGLEEYFDWVMVPTPEYMAKRDKLKKQENAREIRTRQKAPATSTSDEEASTSISTQITLDKEDAGSPDQDLDSAEDITEPTKTALESKSIVGKLRQRFMWARESDMTKSEQKWDYKAKEKTKQERERKFEEEQLNRGWSYLHARFWKARSYSTFMFRRLLELDVDSLVSRQPSRNFITDAEYKRLQYHQVALAAYHRSLRGYENSLFVSMLDPRGNRLDDEYWRSDTWGNWKLGWRAKSLENYVYSQQFKGSERVVQRLFLLDIPLQPWDGQTFRYDQLLPLEDQDKGDRSNLWHEEIPQSMREKVGAYDPFQSKRVAPMFDPVPFYIGWDPVTRKSVLTTSRLPIGTDRVKLTLPIVSTPSKWDFLGIKRFLEETKLYEYVDFLADEDHKFFVYVKDKLDPAVLEENLKKSKKSRLAKEQLEVHQPPSSIRINPEYKRIGVGWKFTKLPSAEYKFELQERLLKMAEEAKEAKKKGEEVPRITPSLIKGLKKRLLLEHKADEAVRQVRQFQKPLVTEREKPFVDVRSPATWFTGVPQSVQKTSELESDQSTDESESDADSDDEESE